MRRLLLFAATLLTAASAFAQPDPLGSFVSNDDIEFAFPLSPGAPAEILTASTADATADPLVDEPDASCQPNANDNSVWWVVRSNNTSPTVTISTAGSTFDTVLSVYTYNGSAFTEIACNDDFDIGTQSLIADLDLLTGFTYYVRVTGFGSNTGNVQIALTSDAPFPPLGNEWRPRSDLMSRFQTAGPRLAYNIDADATVDGEPTAPASCANSPGTHAIWWEYDATEDGFLTLDTIGSDFDTILMVTDFDGNVLACDDDIDGGANRQSRIVNLPVTPSGRYLIRVAGYDGATGVVRFNTAFSTTIVAGEDGADAASVALQAPRPNPTAGSTWLAFTLDAAGQARLAVYDALGREVAVAFDGLAATGETTAAWDARALPAGVYVARLTARGGIATQRVTVVR